VYETNSCPEQALSRPFDKTTAEPPRDDAKRQEDNSREA
jgi:hypothetical protein